MALGREAVWLAGSPLMHYHTCWSFCCMFFLLGTAGIGRERGFACFDWGVSLYQFTISPTPDQIRLMFSLALGRLLGGLDSLRGVCVESGGAMLAHWLRL